MKYSDIYIFDTVINYECCYLREATCVYEPVRDRINFSILREKEIVVGYSFTSRLRESIKELNRDYNFNLLRKEI